MEPVLRLAFSIEDSLNFLNSACQSRVISVSLIRATLDSMQQNVASCCREALHQPATLRLQCSSKSRTHTSTHCGHSCPTADGGKKEETAESQTGAAKPGLLVNRQRSASKSRAIAFPSSGARPTRPLPLVGVYVFVSVSV